MSSDPRIAKFHAETEKVMVFLHNEFSKLQTGRANAALIENVEVEAYGQRQPLKSVAGISVTDARSIAVQPWDRSVIGNVEKALQIADLGVNPVNDGVTVRLNFPPMTQERREQIVKVVHKLAEEAKISVRKQRQDVHDMIKTEKDEDVKETLMEELQKEVDGANAKIIESAKKKEQEIMTV